MMASINQLHQYEFTSFKVNCEQEVCKWLKERCKKFVFQEEECPLTKRRHYQGRLSLIHKVRPTGFKALLQGGPLEGAHFQPTVGANRNNWTYVMKHQTRMKGPWKDDDPEPAIEPNEIKGKSLMPWQESVVEDCKDKQEHLRIINVIIDTSGGAGKGFLRKYLTYHRIAQIIPVGAETKRIMEWVFQFPSPAYIIDIPRDTSVKGTK